MTIKEKLFMAYIEKSIESGDFDDWFDDDADFDDFTIEKEPLERSKKILKLKAKLLNEYFSAFCDEAKIDLNSEINGDNSLASDLLMKVLTEK